MLIASATMGVEAQQLKSGIDVTNLNQTVKPGNDFYQYACGGWMKKNPLPAAYSRFGIHCLLLIHASAVSTSCRRITTNGSIRF